MSTFEEQMIIANAASFATKAAYEKSETDYLSAIKMSEATADAKAAVEAKAAVNLCYCGCRANHCEHFCSSCFTENKMTSCPMCVEVAEAKEATEVKEVSTPVEFFEFGGMPMARAFCPICHSESNLSVMYRNGLRQLTDGAADGTCHTIACNCLRQSVQFTETEASLFEKSLRRPWCFGTGCDGMRVVELRQYLQKLNPTTPYRMGDQYPQHLNHALCQAMQLTQPLTNFRVVLNADADGVARTVLNVIAQ
jgi:hypothetical protein